MQSFPEWMTILGIIHKLGKMKHFTLTIGGKKAMI